MAASTLLRLLKPRLLSLREHLGGIKQIFPHGDVDVGAWQNLNFYKEYLFGFETLVFATSGILSMHNQLVTLQRERKLEIASYDPFNTRLLFDYIHVLFTVYLHVFFSSSSLH